MEEDKVIIKNNGYQGQWSALLNNEDYSSSSDDLFTIIKSYSKFNEQTDSNKNNYLSRIGIQANPGDVFIIQFISTTNEQQPAFIQIGKTGIYEIDNVRISSLKFTDKNGNFRPMEPNVIIDYIIKEV